MAAVHPEYDAFLQLHANQLLNLDVPRIYWMRLFHKLTANIHDNEQRFLLLEGPPFLYLYATGGWKAIYISSTPITVDNPEHFVQTTTFGEDDTDSAVARPKWYLMDEFGSRILHSDTPNFRVAPFFFKNTSKAYSIMWPIQVVVNGDDITRDFCYGETDQFQRRARLTVWTLGNLARLSHFPDEPNNAYFQKFSPYETWPSADFKFRGLPRNMICKTYIENPELRRYLTDPRFQIVDDPLHADILFYSSRFHDFRTFSEARPKCFINQFPYENVLTMKNLMAVTCRRFASPDNTYDTESLLEGNPRCLAVTYDMDTEMMKFVSHFQKRAERHLDNHWICKPLYLPRGIDTVITKNIDRITRIRETGPKIVCKYVEDPVLFYRPDIDCDVKFDLRSIVFLTNVRPVELCVHTWFIVRFASRAFTMDSLDEEIHFTEDGSKGEMYRISNDDFSREFNRRYNEHGISWLMIRSSIVRIISKLFVAATAEPPPKGLAHSPQSRALYVVDFTLAWELAHYKPGKIMMPKILDVNFGPDCLLAYLKVFPLLMNDIFSYLFMDDRDGRQMFPINLNLPSV